MGIIKNYKWLLILVLLVLAGIFFLFYNFYRHDIKSLEDFLASYGRFDQAISDFSISKTSDTESKANEALVALNTKSAFRISSLIKNERKVMEQARVIADLSAKELESLKIYNTAIQSNDADLDALIKDYSELTSKRKAVYEQFLQLGK